MTTRYLAFAAVAAMLLAAPATAQSPADLLQKAIYAQETLGDLDSAILLYRQVEGLNSASKQQAAQAQYQLVLCMLQKGDRTAAAKELDLLSRNYSDQQDLIAKARKLIPGAAAQSSPPWTGGDASQLFIKRDGAFTGEYLYYSAVPWLDTQEDRNRDPANNPRNIAENEKAVYLWWQLVTKTSTRSIQVKVDHDTMRHMERDFIDSDDVVGDPSALPFAGPAVDAEPLVFRMRALPLAPGYKTTMTTLPFVLGQGTPRTVELAVTGVETVQVVAGKFNCYKVSFAELGQTFWIGVDGARPLVKFQSGNVEAELVRYWTPSMMDDALAFVKTAGWTVVNASMGTGYELSGYVVSPKDNPFGVPGAAFSIIRRYAPPAEIDESLRHAMADQIKHIERNGSEIKVRPETVKTRLVGGRHALSCIIDYRDSNKAQHTELYIWVRSENLLVRFSADNYNRGDASLAVFQWVFDPILATAKIP